MKPYTAIVFVHGIGKQERHENLGTLLAQLEGEASRRSLAIRSFTPGHLASGESDIPFMSFELLDTAHGTWRKSGRFRAYEVFWSPLTAQGARTFQMLYWTLKQCLVPASYLHSNWRQKFRIRLARLHYFRETDALRPSRHAFMVSTFKRFQGALGERFEASNKVRTPGNFAAFLRFLQKRAASNVEREALSTAARRWSETRLRCEVFLTRSALFIAFAASLVLMLTIKEVMALYSGAYSAWSLTLNTIAAPLSVIGLLLLAVWLASIFLGGTFSGVRFWTSFLEDDIYFAKRRQILTQARHIIERILDDKDCERVILIGHSLGTAVVYDALREIGQRNMARADSNIERVRTHKISHFFSLGSPIDKITYIFESYSRKSYRGSQLRETLRGDLSFEPFLNGNRTIDWINYWDRADFVSDPLYTPLGNEVYGTEISTAQIRNVEVVNTRLFLPVRSHVTYLQNQRVIATIFDAMRRKEPASIDKNAKQGSRFSRSVSQAAFILLIASILIAAIAHLTASASLWAVAAIYLGGGVIAFMSAAIVNLWPRT